MNVIGTIVVTVEVITPELAARWLKTSVGNRNISAKAVKRLVMDILAGAWDLNGETIKFNDQGQLMDGHHRLTAIVVSGVTVSSAVFRGAPGKSVRTIDCGVARSFANLLEFEGESNSGTIASSGRLFYRYENKYPNSLGEDNVTHTQLMGQFQRHPEFRESARYVGGKDNLRRILTPSVATVTHFICGLKDPVTRDRFFAEVNSGAQLEAGSPSLVLRETIQSLRSGNKRERRRPEWLFAMTLKAWNAYRKGKKVRLLKWAVGEPFPIAV